MIYPYKCHSCNHEFELSTTIAKRDVPLGEPCEKCGGKLYRPVGAPGISSMGAMTAERRAGDGWQDVLKKIKKGAGRQSTIQTR
jgi:putative FmdB family regulatory protein